MNSTRCPSCHDRQIAINRKAWTVFEPADEVLLQNHKGVRIFLCRNELARLEM